MFPPLLEALGHSLASAPLCSPDVLVIPLLPLTYPCHEASVLPLLSARKNLPPDLSMAGSFLRIDLP